MVLFLYKSSLYLLLIFSGQQIHIPIHPSNLELKSFKMTRDRQQLINRRVAVRTKEADKGKITEVEAMKLD